MRSSELLALGSSELQVGRSSSFVQDREQLVELSAQHPWAPRFVLPVLSSIRLRNGHCRVAGYEPVALWPQFPPCHAGGHRASDLPLLPTLSCCCRTWLFPCPVRMGPKEVKNSGGAHPNPCPHTHRSPQSQPTPAAGQSRAGQGSLQGSAVLAGLALDPHALGAALVWIGLVAPGPCMCMVS